MPVQTRSQTRALSQMPVPAPAPAPVPAPAHTLAPLDFAEEMKTRLGYVSKIDLELTKTRLSDKKYTTLKFLKLQTIDQMLFFIISRLPKIYTNSVHGRFLKTLSEKIAEFKVGINSQYNVPTTPTEMWVVQHFKDTLHMCEAMVTHIKILHA